MFWGGNAASNTEAEPLANGWNESWFYLVNHRVPANKQTRMVISRITTLGFPLFFAMPATIANRSPRPMIEVRINGIRPNPPIPAQTAINLQVSGEIAPRNTRKIPNYPNPTSTAVKAAGAARVSGNITSHSDR